jgi:hypothetical protein
MNVSARWMCLSSVCPDYTVKPTQGLLISLRVARDGT